MRINYLCSNFELWIWIFFSCFHIKKNCPLNTGYTSQSDTISGELGCNLFIWILLNFFYDDIIFWKSERMDIGALFAHVSIFTRKYSRSKITMLFFPLSWFSDFWEYSYQLKFVSLVMKNSSLKSWDSIWVNLYLFIWAL